MDANALANENEFTGAFRAMPGESSSAGSAVLSQPYESDLAGWLARLSTAGVHADRIASPDLGGQLRQLDARKIDTLICCVLDTDPSVPLNAMIAQTYPRQLATGLQMLAQLSKSPRVWITADPDKSSQWFATIRSDFKHPGLKLIPLRGDYPQTDPTLMLFTLLQRRLAPRQLPTEKSALLVDAAAAVALGNCALADGPVAQTPLAVRDHFSQKTHLLSVPIGINLEKVCAFLEIDRADMVFRAGDFLRDQWITAQTLLGHGELVIHTMASHLNANPDPCIRCGWCIEACPTRIHPAGLLDAAQQQDLIAAHRFGIHACIECGICSYVCPTRLPLLPSIRDLKRGSLRM